MYSTTDQSNFQRNVLGPLAEEITASIYDALATAVRRGVVETQSYDARQIERTQRMRDSMTLIYNTVTRTLAAMERGPLDEGAIRHLLGFVVTTIEGARA